MKTFTIQLNDEQMAQLQEVRETRQSRSEESILQQVVERGLYALQYRTARNRKVYAEQAELREQVKELKKQLASK